MSTSGTPDEPITIVTIIEKNGVEVERIERKMVDRRTRATPSSAELRMACEEVFERLQLSRSELRSLANLRPDTLLSGSESELADHDARVELLERRLEADNARLQELSRRRKKLEELEEVASLEDLISELQDALVADREAEQAHLAARADLVRGLASIDDIRADIEAMHEKARAHGFTPGSVSVVGPVWQALMATPEGRDLIEEYSLRHSVFV